MKKTEIEIEKENNGPDSWVFEEDISKMFNSNQKKKGNRKITVLLYILLHLIGYYILFNYYGSAVKAGIIIVFLEIAFFVISVVVSIIQLLCSLVKTKVKKYLPMIVIPIIALFSIIVVLNIYTKGNVSLTDSDIFSFSGNFLTFVGAFCLGYFIYIQDKTRIIEDKRTKVRLLITLMENANTELMNLRHLVRNKNFIQIPENRIELISYNSDWILYYYEYEALSGENRELKDTLNSFFNNVISVNSALKNGQIEMANKINENYIENTLYSINKYNEFEAIICLNDACNDYHFYNTKSWIERTETIDLINELCKKYYFIIENYVYGWLHKHNVKETTEEDDLDREIVDWLLLNSTEIKEKIKYPIDKRIISRVVFNCSCKFENKSERIGYAWGEYYLK